MSTPEKPQLGHAAFYPKDAAGFYVPPEELKAHIAALQADLDKPRRIAELEDKVKTLEGDNARQAQSIVELQAEIERLRAFAKSISEQKPERPDYWNSCGQCGHNIDDAKELVAPKKA